MFVVWLFCILAFIILPFKLETRILSFIGFFYLAGHIICFAAGAVATAPLTQSIGSTNKMLPDLQRVDKLLLGTSMTVVILLLAVIAQGNFLDLASAYSARDARAGEVLNGVSGGGNTLFQIAFLLYPAAFVCLSREVIFRKEIKLLRLFLLAILPIILVSIVMGGRGPMLYAIGVLLLSYKARSQIFGKPRRRILGLKLTPRKLVSYTAVGTLALVAFNYFVTVFIVRAAGVGGTSEMYNIAAQDWGVSFDGAGSQWLISTIGQGNAYLVYVFIWYLIQGLIMSNQIFSAYDGPNGLGIYGFDLVTAVVRRVDGQAVTNVFYPLLDMNVYGFLPSAFGSLYVDFGPFSFVAVVLWGCLAGLVFQRIRESIDARWVLLGPFVSVGIFFSLINTPLGFGNGLVTHFWLILSFLVARKGRIAGINVRGPRGHSLNRERFG